MKKRVKMQNNRSGARLCRSLLPAILAVFCAAGLQSSIPAAASSDTVIPSSAVYFDGHYYAILDDMTSMNNAGWDTAERLCNAAGGHLAVIDSESESQYLFSLLGRNGFDAAFFGAYHENGEWYWVNGAPFTYNNWTESANDGSPYGVFLASDESGQWHSSRFGNFGTAYICEWESGIPCTERMESISKDDLIQIGHKFYKFFDIGLPHADAEAFCEAQDGHLARIDSEELQNELMEKLEAHGTRTMYWIGAADVGGWNWISGEEASSMEYTNWSSGEPANNTGDSIYCVLNLKSDRFQKGGWVSESEVGAKYSEAEHCQNYGLICEWDSVCSDGYEEYPWHEGTWVVVEDADCQQAGLFEFTCQHCGKVLDSKTGTITDHRFEQMRINKHFSFYPVPGLLKYRCEVCGETKTDLDPKGLVLDGTLLGLFIVAIAAYFSAVRDYKQMTLKTK